MKDETKRLMATRAAFSLLAALCCAAAVPQSEAAQSNPDAAANYPSRPIRVIVPFGVGSITDLLARSVSPRLSEVLGAPIIVDDRPGGGGNPGTDLGVKATPDGYTLIMGSASNLAINSSLFSNMPYDMATAFAPISQVAMVTNVLVVTPMLPVKSVQELIAYGKANPGKLSFASAGAGGTIHLAGEMFKAMTGVKMEHVVYKASPIAHIDMFNGQIHVMFDGLPPAMPQIRAGKLRALAVATAKRSQLVPELPTIAEAGVPGYDVQGWNGLVGPARTPRPIIEKLHRELVRVIAMPDVRERLLGMGAEPVGSSPAEFAQHMRVERERWGKLIRQIGLKLD